MSPGLAARAVLFDLDGTLVDSFAAITASLNHARVRLGHEPLALAAVRGRVGWGLDRLLAGVFPPAELAAAAALYRDHYRTTALAATAVLPGAREALVALRARGLLTGVCTNKAAGFSRDLLAGFGLLPLLDVVVGDGEGARLKPDPDMIERALRALGVKPVDAVYVGDMEVDVQAGRAAGVRVVAVATGAAGRAALTAAGADLVIDHLGALDVLLAPLLAPPEAGAENDLRPLAGPVLQ